jgi:putative membrane protein
MYGHMGGMWGAGHAWFWPGAAFPMLFGVALVVLGLWLVSGGGMPWDRLRANRAIEILDERYAAGELSTEEYQERLAHLRRA